MTDEMLALPRFVDEVEHVRQALGVDQDNFYLYGQSWGGVLAIEYALRHQEHLKALIVSNMVASIPLARPLHRHIDLRVHVPKHMEWMAQQLPRGHYLYCPNGSHLAIYDDQRTYMTGLVNFIKGVDSGTIS